MRGGTPAMRAQVRAALGGEVGKSLLRVDSNDARAATRADSDGACLRFDRAFPHTLRVIIKRRGAVARACARPTRRYLVAASGRVIRPLAHPRRSGLPRLWVTKAVHVAVGQALPAAGGGGAAALAPLRGAALPSGVAVRAGR